MRLLVVTQIIDTEDTYLSFFHTWVTEFSKHFESIIVICLKEGKHALPENVRVLSLGKEEGVSKMTYIVRFFSYVWHYRKEYDAVFVHMNQEYVLLGGLLWRLLKKRVTMWRNHNVGGFLTDVAAFFCHKVFCTSHFSYTAKYKKTVFMPVGVSTDMFFPHDEVRRVPRSILSLGRISPSKNIEVLLDAVKKVKERSVPCTLTICGDVLPEQREYVDHLRTLVKTYALEERVTFRDGVPYEKVPTLFTEHAICVNQTDSGSFDKTIFEAMLCETLVVSCNGNLKGEVEEVFLFKEGDADGLANSLVTILSFTENKREEHAQKLREYAQQTHSLKILVQKLFEELVR